MDSEHNPYQAPNRADGISTVIRRPLPSASSESTKLALYAQMLLRVFGVLLIIEGIGLAVFAIAFGVVQSRDYVASGYTAYQGLFNPYSVGYGCWGAVSLGGGLYLTIGGRWLIQALFVPSVTLDPDEQYASAASDAESRNSSET